MPSPQSTPIPRTYRPEFAEEARKLSLLGVTDEALPGHFGIPLATLHDWLASIPEFAQAVRFGRTLGDAEIVDRLQQNAMGFFYEVVQRPVGANRKPVRSMRFRPPNQAALNFWRSNRPGEWCEKLEVAAGPRADGVSRLVNSAFKRFIAQFATARGSAPDE